MACITPAWSSGKLGLNCQASFLLDHPLGYLNSSTAHATIPERTKEKNVNTLYG